MRKTRRRDRRCRRAFSVGRNGERVDRVAWHGDAQVDDAGRRALEIDGAVPFGRVVGVEVAALVGGVMRLDSPAIFMVRAMSREPSVTPPVPPLDPPFSHVVLQTHQSGPMKFCSYNKNPKAISLVIHNPRLLEKLDFAGGSLSVVSV